MHHDYTPRRSTLAIIMAAALAASSPGTPATAGEAGAATMTRAEIYAEMESMLGLVPTFLKNVPDSTLGLEWELMKRVQMVPGPIPNKHRELIGVAVAAATKCDYCIYFHTEFARLNGATDAEIEDALHYTKSTTGWSTYINGSQTDMEVFREEVDAIVKYLTKQAASRGDGGTAASGPVTAATAGKAKFQEVTPGVSKSPLWGSDAGGPYGAFTRFDPGFDAGVHTHTHDVWIVGIKGAYVYKDDDGEKRIGPGDFIRIKGGHAHRSGGDKQEGALFYEEASGAFDLVPAE